MRKDEDDKYEYGMLYSRLSFAYASYIEKDAEILRVDLCSKDIWNTGLFFICITIKRVVKGHVISFTC